MSKHFGKYRGKVENNIDPMLCGRIQVSVPSVLGKGRLAWALPSAPYAGSGVGFVAIPPNRANVWVEFEGGNTDVPIWSGCFWGTGEFPSEAALPEIKIFKTDTATLTFNDVPGAGGITIETTDGKKITMDALSIEITDGTWSIKISPSSVAINDDALEVT
jgi:Type VI secretion system/phage-baseplate injector OB domain